MKMIPIFVYNPLTCGWDEPNGLEFILKGTMGDLKGTTPEELISKELGIMPERIHSFFVDPYGRKYDHDGLQLFVTLKPK